MNGLRKLARLIFFGNYFYGLCVVALAIEASLQQHFPLNSISFYVLLFTATVLYYSKAYLVTETSADSANIRSAWYGTNRRAILASQYLLAVIFILIGSFELLKVWRAITAMDDSEWFLVLVFPFVSVLYYGFSHRGKAYNIRNIGWLKPFVIGFTWAGLVNVYPAIYQHLLTGTHFMPDVSAIFLFVKNFMFISILCIMFDIKDYDMDYNVQLKTFVVKLGPLYTIWLVMIPLSLLGLASFLAYAAIQGFSAGRILVNTIPFILLTAIGASLHRERTIFYYLVIIDGLMLLKAICGIAGVLYF